jgi:GntR family transcriptional regulator
MMSSLHNPVGNRSLRIAERLRQAIIGNILPAGARLPGQRELAQTYATTLMTIRQALALLEAEGLIRFEHGVGTFVTDIGLDPDALQLASFGETGAGTVLQTIVQRVEPAAHAPEQARLLSLPPETPLVMIERLRVLDGEPIVFQQSFLPPTLSELVPVFRPDISLYRQLQAQFGERAAVSRETLQPVALAAAQASLLARPAGAPAFRSCRLTLNLQSRPLVYDEALLVGDRWMLVGDRLGRRGDWEMRLDQDGPTVLASLTGSDS